MNRIIFDQHVVREHSISKKFLSIIADCVYIVYIITKEGLKFIIRSCLK